MPSRLCRVEVGLVLPSVLWRFRGAVFREPPPRPAAAGGLGFFAACFAHAVSLKTWARALSRRTPKWRRHAPVAIACLTAAAARAASFFFCNFFSEKFAQHSALGPRYFLVIYALFERVLLVDNYDNVECFFLACKCLWI